MQLKYCGIWLVLVLVMLFCQIGCFYISYVISVYNKHWLTVLRENSAGYECTNESLWINIVLL